MPLVDQAQPPLQLDTIVYTTTEMVPITKLIAVEPTDFQADPNVLYCICQQPETWDMIGCDKCDEWFHAKCFGINLLEIPDIEKFEFVCPGCRPKEEAEN